MSWARESPCEWQMHVQCGLTPSRISPHRVTVEYQSCDTKEADVLRVPSRAEVVIDDADRTTSSLAYFMFNQQAGMYVVVVCG